MEHEKIKEESEEKKQNYYDKKPSLGSNGHSEIWMQFRRGITYFLVTAAAIAFYFLFYRLGHIFEGIKTALSALRPVVYGAFIAYILAPLVNWLEKYLIVFFGKYIKKERFARQISRSIAIFLSIVALLAVVILLINLLIPELLLNIRRAANTVPRQLSNLVDGVSKLHIKSNAGEFAATFIDKGVEMLKEWIDTALLPKTNLIMSDLTEGVIATLKELFYMVIGILISIYLLFSKEVFAAQAKKTVYAFFKPQRANTIIHVTRKAKEIYSGFIIGKIVDSVIIGVLCFIGLNIVNIWFSMPYILLVSVVIGITNVIPFFGPYLGAIASALLIALHDPVKGLIFLLFALVLQQIDGNIIGPKILGNSTGLSSFWVIFSILLGGGLFGVPGMILGVPTFALFYYMLQLIINQRLERKDLPAHSIYYDPDSYVDEKGIFYCSDKAKEGWQKETERQRKKQEKEGWGKLRKKLTKQHEKEQNKDETQKKE